MSSFTKLAFWKTYLTPARFSNDQIPDLTGKVAIVTGANTGLGYATTVALAGHNCHVILACRSRERAEAAIEKARKEIKATYPRAAEAKLEFLELDLNDMTKAKKSAQDFLGRGLPIHILVNNSGIVGKHFVFTMTLLDRIKESQPSRIVILSSLAHEHPTEGGIDFETLNDESASTNRSRYGRSKLANLLFGKALARRLADTQVYCNIVHPGFVATDLARDRTTWARAFQVLFNVVRSVAAMTPKDGALTQLYAATSPEIVNKDIRGRYFIPIANELTPSPLAQDEALQEKLWAFSEAMVRQHVKA
ncbi:hypothetical protein EMPS_07161 [Entomortierella parvispora]|uniref:NAD(P)-binding protein n=1 Tax=Entomortierella parvispora TaxID=205924 RepID=A0A9P3HE23_9FUNG|nr:hypothetical protein EMPS_07161 [Entomortierella parvispora]